MTQRATLERLPNGLQAVFVPDDHVESVCFGLFVSSGSRHESAEDAGMSHFIEHMLFKGTEKRSALEISQAIEGRGGNFNAYTSEESTCFYAHMPYDCIGTAVGTITDMYMNASIPDDEFERERGVVLEEIKMYGDEPDSVASENLSRAMFPGNALGMPIAGTPETLGKMTPRRMREYIKRAYVPAATTAVLAGRFDTAEGMRLIAETLGRMPEGKPLKYEAVNARKRPVKEVTAERDIRQVQLAMGFRTFGVRAPLRKKYAAKVFDCLMGKSMSSRLFQSIRERRGLSYDIHSQLQHFEETGGWAITAGLDTARVDEAFAAIERELKLICAKKPSAAELRRTKDYLIGNFRLGMEAQRSRMFYYGGCAQTYGKLYSPDEIIAGLEGVTAAEVLEAANEIITERNRSVSWVKPKE